MSYLKLQVYLCFLEGLAVFVHQGFNFDNVCESDLIFLLFIIYYLSVIIFSHGSQYLLTVSVFGLI